MPNIENSFLTENRSVFNFLNQTGQGLYIPLYQRDYSWDTTNIEQMIEDITRGIQRIAYRDVTDDNKEIRFLGTVITVVEANRDNIYPVDPQAVPSRVEKIIDGQQRVSTITLFATLLTKRLTEIQNRINSSNPLYNVIKEICNIWIEQRLCPMFSFDLGRGTPKLKPKIARGSSDYWTRDGKVDDAYKSELSNYLGHFIESYINGTGYPALSHDKYGESLIYKNCKKIDSWLRDEVAKAHLENKDIDFASALDIIENFNQNDIWDFPRNNLVDIIKKKDFTSRNKDSYILAELVQTLSVCHYLLNRCCFTIIQPKDDDWAFDMFQSLNATGTPLTAIETFKPTIVNTIEKEPNLKFKGSVSERYFAKLEDYLNEANNAQDKNKRTNEYLTSLFISFDGRTSSTHFSYQRQALHNIYTNLLPSLQEKEAFVKHLGNYAVFYKEWLNYTGKNLDYFPMLNANREADLASLLILFLKNSNHKMAITMLGCLYGCIIENEANSVNEFINGIKAISAFYYLWRSTYPNGGLDTTYREFFKKLKNNGEKCSVEAIKRHFCEVLVEKGIDSKANWTERAKGHLKYGDTTNEIIRLSIFLSSEDVIPDTTTKGLMKIGRPGSLRIISLENWVSSDLKTIEHIAPQNNSNGDWDNRLYDPVSKNYNNIGNLTLLPQSLNTSAGNRCWAEKVLYYKSVGEKDTSKLDDLFRAAKQLNITINNDTIQMLKDAKFNDHLNTVSSLSVADSWNLELVNMRTDKLLDIVYDRIIQWLK